LQIDCEGRIDRQTSIRGMQTPLKAHVRKRENAALSAKGGVVTGGGKGPQDSVS
jgi:hypothetical protein